MEEEEEIFIQYSKNSKLEENSEKNIVNFDYILNKKILFSYYQYKMITSIGI